jgi:hypothetical protein
MADDLTLRLGADAQQAIDTLQRVERQLGGIVAQVKGAGTIYDQFGNVVSTATAKVETGGTKATGATSALAGSVAKLAGAFSIANIIDRVASGLGQMAVEAVNSASRMLDLKDVTGLTTDTLQRFDYVEQRTNTTQGALALSAFNLSKALASPSDSVKAALESVGLSMERLDGKSVEEQFFIVTKAINETTGAGTRNDAATVLLGRTWKEVAPAVRADIESLGKSARVSTEEQLKAISEATAAWRGFKADVQATTTDILGSLVLIARQAISTKQTASEIAQGFGTAKVGFGEGDAAAAARRKELIDESNKAIAEAQGLTNQLTASVTRATQAQVTYVSRLKDSELQLKNLSQATKDEIAAGLKMGDSEEHVAEKLNARDKTLKLTTATVHLYKEQLQDATTANEQAARKEEERAEALQNIQTGLSTLTQAQYDQIAALLKAGKSESDIAKAYRFTAGEVHAVSEAEQARTVALKAQADIQGTLFKLQKENEKDAAERTKKYYEEQQKGAQHLAENLLKVIQIEIDAENRLQLARTTGTAKRLLEIGQAETRELEALKKQGFANTEYYQVAEQRIKEYYQHERDLALGTADTIVERMKARGVETRAELERTAAEARRDYEQMREAGVFTADALRAAWERWQAAERAVRGDIVGQWHTALSSLASGFQQIAQIADGSMSAISRTVGTAIATVDQLITSLDKANKLSATTAEKITAGIASFTATYSFFSGLSDSINQSATELRAFEDRMRETEALAREFATALGDANTHLAFSRDLMEQIEATRSQLFDPTTTLAGIGTPERAAEIELRRQQAVALNLQSIIKELGGLTAQNIGLMAEKARPLLDLIAQGGASGALALDQLNGLVSEFVAYADKAGVAWDANFRALIDRARALGLELDSINQAVQGQLDIIGGATQGLLAGIRANVEAEFRRLTETSGAQAEASAEAIAAANATIVANFQTEFDRASLIVLDSFNTWRAQGKSIPESVSAVGPAIDDLIASAERFGFAGTEAFDRLKRWRELTVENKPLLDQIGTLNQLTIAQANLNGLTQDSFARLEQQGLSAYRQLTAAGFTEADAKEAIRPLIETLIRLSKERGLALDDETQAIVDQMRADGQLRTEQQTTNDILKEGLGAIIKALKGDVPSAWKTAADAAVAEADRIKRDATEKIKVELGTVESQLRDDGPWKRWRDLAVSAADEAAGAVNRLNFGASPGGLKEIPLQLERARAAGAAWQADFMSRLRDAQALADRWAMPSVALGLVHSARSAGENAAAAGTVSAASLPTHPPIYLTLPVSIGGDTYDTLSARIVDRRVFIERISDQAVLNTHGFGSAIRRAATS